MANVTMHSKKWEDLREKYKHSLWHLCYEILDYRDIDNQFHRRELAAYDELRFSKASNEVLSTMHLWPRGHLKSTIFTIGDSIREIAIDQNIRILILNATGSNAENFLGSIADHIISNEKLNFFFPEIKPPDERDTTWNRQAIVVNRTKYTPEPTVRALGIDSNIVSQHFDIHKYDDIENWENSQTPERIETLYEKYQYSLSVLEPNGIENVIGTRYGSFDIYHRMINTDLFKCSIKQLTMNSARGKKEYIFPQKFDAKVEERLKKTMRDYIFYCQYYNDPVVDDKKLFNKKMIQYYETLPPNGVHYLTVDPASATSSYADKTAMIDCYWVGPCARYTEGAIFVYKFIKERLATAAFLEMFFGMTSETRPEIASVEISGSQSHTLWDLIINEDHHRNASVNLHRYKPKPSESKHARIASMQPAFKRGIVYMKEEHIELAQQLLAYTGTKKHEEDDLIDALAQQFQIGSFPPGILDEDDDEEEIYRPLFRSTGY